MPRGRGGPPPLGALIERRRVELRPRVSQSEAARRAGISDSWWRQVVSGVRRTNRGDQRITAPSDTWARMAVAVGLVPDDVEPVDAAVAGEMRLLPRPTSIGRDRWLMWAVEADRLTERERDALARQIEAFLDLYR